MRSGLYPDPVPPTSDPPDLTPLAAQLRAVFEAGFRQLLQDLFTHIDDELFKLSDKADSSALQALYFDAMRQIRREQTGMRARCLREILNADERFWTPADSPSTQPEDSGNRGLTLMENDALEIELAVSHAAQKTNLLFQDTLRPLELRLAALKGVQRTPLPPHPFAPEALCRAFAASLTGQPVDIRVTLLILKLFDRHVLCKMGTTYRQMNQLLAEYGVTPDTFLAPKTKTSAMPEQEASSSAAHLRDDDSEEQLSDLLHLLDLWKRRRGNAASLLDTRTEGKHFDAGEVVNALSLLQQSACALASGEYRPGAPIPRLKHSLVDQLAGFLPDGERRRLGQLEEDIIDMVSMIFDFILEDRNLPDPVKALIARLQIPVVKVAIIERSFLAKKTHPLRLLLNALAQAGMGLDSNDRKDQIVLKKIEEVVYRILTEFDKDTRMFAALLEDFSAFIARECKGVTAMEERTRQAALSQERLALAKRAAAIEITARIERRPLPGALVSLLLNAWKDVLVLAHLRREKDPADWEEALAIMDRLIVWAGDQDAGTAEPEVIRAARDKLENIAFDPVQLHAFLKDLELWRLSRRQPGSPPLADATVPELSDIEEILIQSIEGGRPAEPSAPAIDESFIEQARNLRIGDWVEFCDGSALPFRAKLLLKSQFTSRYVFVNRRGMKLREISVNELAAGLAANTIRLIAGANEPLLDRAMDAVVDTLACSRGQSDSSATS
ncbi:MULTISPECIES: DUF1631 domain-containing protein [Methylococcus]|uniref:DUF1631 domain-containing protein n=1 Tax=Methylococcus capsulatus TaxID=414 RepID=A0ABZ2F9U4_METCP|nr:MULTISPECIES: DUF1631 domain-containing protein [Methylococcus]MDF9393268.1 DUF1631 domain-containing protein [Methylococcus capsulatus]